MEFGKRLKEMRIQAGLTQAQLGARVGVTKSVISFYEQQERSPSPDMLIRFARIFHVSTDHLLGLEQRSTIDVTDLDEGDVAIVRYLAQSLQKRSETSEDETQLYFQRIRDMREDSDLTQVEVARILGIQQTVYSRYERGVQTIPLEHLIKLADYYDVSLDFLTGRTQRMEMNK